MGAPLLDLPKFIYYRYSKLMRKVKDVLQYKFLFRFLYFKTLLKKTCCKYAGTLDFVFRIIIEKLFNGGGFRCLSIGY